MQVPPSSEISWAAAHRAIVPLMRVDNRTNLVYLLKEYALLALVLAASILALRGWQAGRLGTIPFALMALLGVACIAAIQHRFSALAHDASHYAFFKNKWANELVSDYLLMFPIMGMTQRFRATHLGHHQYLNDPIRDPDVVRLNHPDPQRFPTEPGAFVWRYVVRALWPPNTWGYLFGQAKGANLSDGAVAPLKTLYRFRLGRCMRGSYWLSVLTLVTALHAWDVFLLFWVVPLLTVFPLLMQVREIVHHSNAPDDGELGGSRIFRVHPLLSACVFPYGQDDHLTHHLFAMVPHYNMRRAHEILMRCPTYRDQATVCRGFFVRSRGTDGPSVLEVLARPPRPGELIWDGPPRRMATPLPIGAPPSTPDGPIPLVPTSPPVRPTR